MEKEDSAIIFVRLVEYEKNFAESHFGPDASRSLASHLFPTCTMPSKSKKTTSELTTEEACQEIERLTDQNARPKEKIASAMKDTKKRVNIRTCTCIRRT